MSVNNETAAQPTDTLELVRARLEAGRSIADHDIHALVHEIDRLRKAKADEWQDEGVIDYLKRENAYLRARQAPVYFMIDRGNYSEMIQVFHPLDQKRIGDLIMAQNPPDGSRP